MKENKKSVESLSGHLTSTVLLIFGAGVSIALFNLYQENDSLRTVLSQETANSEHAQFLLDDVEADLRELLEREGVLTLDLFTTDGLGATQREALSNEISSIEELLETNRIKVATLEETLGSGHAEVQRYQRDIALLEQSLSEQKARVELYKQEKEEYAMANLELAEGIADRDGQLREKDEQLEHATQAFNTVSNLFVKERDRSNKAYFAVGSYKDL